MPRTLDLAPDARTLAGYLSPTPAKIRDLLVDTGWSRRSLQRAMRDLSGAGVPIIYLADGHTIRVHPESMPLCRELAG